MIEKQIRINTSSQTLRTSCHFKKNIHGQLNEYQCLQIIELRKDPVGNDRRIRATLRKAKCTPVDSNSSVMQDDIRHLMQENARYKQLLEEVSLDVQ